MDFDFSRTVPAQIVSLTQESLVDRSTGETIAYFQVDALIDLDGARRCFSATCGTSALAPLGPKPKAGDSVLLTIRPKVKAGRVVASIARAEPRAA